MQNQLLHILLPKIAKFLIALQDSGDLATDFSVAKSKKSVPKSISRRIRDRKNSVDKTLLAKFSDENFQSVSKFSDGCFKSVGNISDGFEKIRR